MKTTKRLIIAVTAVLSFFLISTSVWAGSKQQHRWEGVAIGVGAAIVGSALINHNTYSYHGGPPVAFSYHYREPYRNHRGYSLRHRGHRKPYYGGHHNYRRFNDRGHDSRGHRQHWNTNGNRRHEGNWKSHSRGHDGSRRSHSRGHGGRRN